MLAALTRPLNHRPSAWLQGDCGVAVEALEIVAELLVLSDPPPGALTLGAVGVVDGHAAVGLKVEDVA